MGSIQRVSERLQANPRADWDRRRNLHAQQEENTGNSYWDETREERERPAGEGRQASSRWGQSAVGGGTARIALAANERDVVLRTHRDVGCTYGTVPHSAANVRFLFTRQPLVVTWSLSAVRVSICQRAVRAWGCVCVAPVWCECVSREWRWRVRAVCVYGPREYFFPGRGSPWRGRPRRPAAAGHRRATESGRPESSGLRREVRSSALRCYDLRGERPRRTARGRAGRSV